MIHQSCLEAACKFVDGGDYKNVMIQNGTGPHTFSEAVSLHTELSEAMPDVMFVLYGEYKANCCLDDLTAIRSECEAIIFLGNCCYSPSTLPHLVIPNPSPPQTEVSTWDKAEEVVEWYRGLDLPSPVPLALLSEASDHWRLASIRKAIEAAGVPCVTQEFAPTPTASRSIHNRFIPEDAPIAVYGDSLLADAVAARRVTLTLPRPAPTRRSINMRFGQMTALKSATRIGLVPIVHSKDHEFLAILDMLEAVLAARGLGGVVCHVADPTPEKLDNFTDIDGWVIVSRCPNAGTPPFTRGADGGLEVFGRGVIQHPVCAVWELLTALDLVTLADLAEYQVDLSAALPVLQGAAPREMPPRPPAPVRRTWIPDVGGEGVGVGRVGTASGYSGEGSKLTD